MNGLSFNNIEEAVLCFYQSNHILHGEAKTLLAQLTETPQIWSIIWDELLSSKHAEIQFYGATVLHAKLLKSWSEIPIEEIEPLRTKLLQSVVYFKDGPKLVLNRICISLAVYLLRTITSCWPNAIRDLISRFQDPSLLQNIPNSNPEILTWLLLELLCVIPEEFQTIILSKNERVFVRSAMEGDNCTVLPLLEAAISSPNIDLKLQAVKCCKTWLEFGLPTESCDNLLNLLIDTVRTTYVNYEQCSINAIEAISILCTQRNISKYPKTVLEYLRKVLLLADLCSSTSNNEFVSCLYTLFVTIGDSHVKIFLTSMLTINDSGTFFLTNDGEAFVKLLRIILQCSNAPGSYPKDEVYSIQTFNFWYSLQDEIISTEFDGKEEILSIIKPFYKDLILVLMEKSMHPKDISMLSRDDRDNFRCYRQDIADTYTYCYSILHHELLEIIAQHLEQEVNNPNVIEDWRKVDSCLYAFFAISENNISSANPRILHCIHLLQKLPLPNMDIQVFQTVMELLGSYAEWMCLHPHLLEPVLSLVFTGAENPQLAVPATLALKDITRECKSALLPFAEGIAHRTMELLKRKHFKATEEYRLVFSLGIVVSLLPKDTILSYLQEIVKPYLQRIDTILEKPSENNKKTEMEIVYSVGVFQHLFMGLVVNPVDPVLCLLEEVLPRFEDILTQYRGQMIISSVCDAIKSAVINLENSCYKLLPRIVNLILTTFNSHPDHELFELAKQLLILFGNNVTFGDLMNSMFQDICRMSLNIFGNTSLENVSQHTCLMEIFYSFCTNVLKKNINLLLKSESGNLILLLRFAGYAMCAQEAGTVKTAASFLSNLITVSREQPLLLAIVHDHGEELVYNILIAIGKVSPRDCIEHVSDVLVALSKKYSNYLSIWLQKYLSEDSFPSNRATPEAKQRFIRSVLKQKANKRRVHDLTKEFSFLCRGLLNKDYVDITSSDFKF